ncbi:MAG TPA: DUF3861 family protein [Burkholderiaceae bacterium]|nr:DUF3861 family protein [Burkholderiaceae bacterium]
MNRRYAYRVTLAPVSESGEPVASPSSVVFTHGNHDDLARMVMLVRESPGLDADSSAAMAIGLKLLAQTMIEQKTNPLFDVLRGPLREFITMLKSRRTDTAAKPGGK